MYLCTIAILLRQNIRNVPTLAEYCLVESLDPPCCRYYLDLSTKQRKEWEQRLEELKKASAEEVSAS